MLLTANKLPTYEDCVSLCAYEGSPFYERKTSVEGYRVSLFDYQLALNSDFNKQFAKELRGLTFVFDEAGRYKRFLLLEKFFNLNQTEETQYSVIKNYKLKFVYEKEDGSVISFVRFPNGNIRAKSKMSFETMQAKMAQKIYSENKDVSQLVNWALDNNIVPIFEYVSPENRIVLEYKKDELILLKLRDNCTGKYLDLNDYLTEIGSAKIAPIYTQFTTLDDIIENVEGKINKEGFVVQMEDNSGNDFLFKIKSPWYVGLHKVMTEVVNRENIIIQYILEGTIDDVIGQIPEEKKDVHDRINRMIYFVKTILENKSQEIEEDYKLFLDMGADKKEFALKYLKTPNFKFVMSMTNGKSSYDLAKSWLFDNTKKLLSARAFIKKIDPSFLFVHVLDHESV